MAIYPTIRTQNQYGEQSISTIVGGSVDVYCSFSVLATDPTGITGLDGVDVASVYMQSSAATPSGPVNPANGLIQVNFSEAFNSFLSADVSVQSSTSTNVNVTSGLTANAAYVITSVGTTTSTAWHTLGLNAGILAADALGAGFIAKTAVASTGTGVVQTAVGTDGYNIVVIGDPSKSSNVSTGGASLVLGYYVEGALAAPPDGTVIRLKFQFKPAIPA